MAIINKTQICMTLQAIFWDNDGVLVDTERFYYQANKEILATIGIEVTPELYHEFFLAQSKGMWHIAAERGFSSDQIEELREQRNSRYEGLLQENDLAIRGAEGVLQTLHGTYHMGIVTSAPREHFELIHQSTKVLDYMSFVLAAGDYARSKPAPDPYLKALERTGFTADECIVVEDSERGLRAARAAGLKCIVVPHNLTQYGDFSEAYKVLGALSELPDVLSF